MASKVTNQSGKTGFKYHYFVILMDETDKALILKRDALESLIDKYYDKKNEIFNAPKDAIKTAVDHFEGQINNIQDITIKNIILHSTKIQQQLVFY